jgi:malonyl-CoA O-methyltransferase
VGALDYTGRAEVFRRRRTLPAPILEAWRAAVTPRLPPARRVLDVGAGTGQFAAPLAAWTAAPVVALEPSAAMRAELVATGAPIVAARAEAVPLATGSFDVAWLSTVVHQFDDLAAAVAELARVLRAGGRVLVRGFVADQGPFGLGHHFPGIERSIARFPTVAALTAAFAAGGLALHDVVEVREDWSWDLAAWADGAAELRHADSMLAPLTDDEFAAGVASVRAEGERRPGVQVVPGALTLLTFTR